MDPSSLSGLAATIARIRELTGAVPTAVQAAPGFGQAFAGASAAVASPAAAGATSTAVTAAPASAAGVTGAQLDAWMAARNPSAPLVGLGDVIVREGQANGVDPRAIAAIAAAESGLGADPGARARNNAFGWGPNLTFPSWEQNIATVARGLRTGYLDKGLVTLPQIQSRYAPLGVANDPSNLNSNWLRNTSQLYAQLGGDPSGSIALA